MSRPGDDAPASPTPPSAAVQASGPMGAGVVPLDQRHLNFLFDHVADVIFFLEVLGADRYRFVAVNQRFAGTTGLRVADVIGKEIDEVIPPASLELVKRHYRQAIETGKTQHWEEVSNYPSGTKTGEVSVSPAIEADGGCCFLMGVVHDVTEQRRRQQELSILEQRWRLALEFSGAGAWEWQADTGLLTVFPAWQDIVGMAVAPLRTTRAALASWAHPDDVADIEHAVAGLLSGRSERLDVEGRVRHRDGSWIWIRAQGKLMVDTGGKPKRMLGTITDISAIKSIQHELELGAIVFQNSHEAIAVVDPGGRILTVNPAFTRMRGYLPDEIVGKAPRVYNAGLDDANIYDAIWEQLHATGQWCGELWSRHKDGHVIAEYRSIAAACGADRQVRYYIEIGTDVTETKKAEELAWRQGNYDALTGLPNRQLFLDRLGQAIERAREEGGGFTLLVIDLDRFKDVNETLGHSKGDLILKEAARRLIDGTGENDTVARFGADEFAVLLRSAFQPGADRQAVGEAAQAIIDSMAQPFLVGDETLHLSASVGITHYPKDATDMESLVKHANQAMHTAKEQGRNRYAYFSHIMQERAQARRQLIKDLRACIAAERLKVHYQPIICLETGQMRKAESLVRWNHPQKGPISPVEFIPLCEETGLIVELGEQIFKTVVRDVGRWIRDNHAEMQVSINVSPVQLLSGHEVSERCFRMARNAGIPDRTLVIEVTEGMLLDNNPFVIQQLRQIVDHGMELALDDFGTGYSSLSYLKKFNFHFLKIDRAFVMHLAAGTTDYALCDAIITMAHKLGMQVIAEGVETEEQMRLLREAGCDFGQGLLFSRPVPADELGGWLASGAPPWIGPGTPFPDV
ncbi:sensor domain-containing protein [Massilia terrae]|uniref:EAL domain-containing protein n=1 Tax=Massilia terrae TaxID=1811224 RepID=A0ABT2D4C4_9BURK|nr:EAL domain-containing protein [Massilia terrae]MCS0661051.1 EAL domain-containing protein [Massilia terrae]